MTRHTDPIYIRLRDTEIVRTHELEESNVLIDYGRNGLVVGIEVVGENEIVTNTSKARP